MAQKISFRVYWPRSGVSIPERTSIKFSTTAGVFSYVIYLGGVSVTVDEQSTPSEFSDIPNYYATLVNHLNNYDTFTSANGTVYLTEPHGTNGEVAVNNNEGTLVFAHAHSKIPVNSWQKLFNNLIVIDN